MKIFNLKHKKEKESFFFIKKNYFKKKIISFYEYCLNTFINELYTQV